MTITSCSTNSRTRFSPPTDQLAERVRKLGGTTVKSIGQIGKLADHQGQQRGLRPAARDAARIDGRQQAHRGRHAQSPQLADDHEDSGTAGLLETFIDETERRTWFLFEASRQEGSNAA